MGIRCGRFARVDTPLSINDTPYITVHNLMVILQILQGNVDTLTVHKNMFDWRINARYIRINPRAWTPIGQICMRVEIYLCHNYQGE